MDTLSYSDIISTLAFIAALGALAWNIVRDFVSNQISIEFHVAFGEMGNIKNSNTGLFADAGSLLPAHYFDNPGVLVEIINTGCKPIAISGVGGELNRGEEISMMVSGLPKMLQPYEVFRSMGPAKQHFIEQVQKNGIKDLWAIDTKGRKWRLSAKARERLISTADFIYARKHIFKK